MKAIRHIPISESLSFGWKKTFENFGFILGFLVVAVLIQIGIGAAQAVSAAIFAKAPGMLGLVVFLFFLIRVAANAVIGMAGIKATLILVAGKKPTLSSAYKGMTEAPLIFQYLLASIVTGIITVIGFIFLIIPGIYFLLKYAFTGYNVVDKGSSFSDAMGSSSDITEGVKWELFVFGIVTALTNLIGLLCLGVGLLVTVPMTQLARGYVYRHLMKTA